jgi:hypothetical protein
LPANVPDPDVDRWTRARDAMERKMRTGLRPSLRELSPTLGVQGTCTVGARVLEPTLAVEGRGRESGSRATPEPPHTAPAAPRPTGATRTEAGGPPLRDGSPSQGSLARPRRTVADCQGVPTVDARDSRGRLPWEGWSRTASARTLRSGVCMHVRRSASERRAGTSPLFGGPQST